MSNKVQSLDLDNPNQPIQQQDGPVECLGKTFENDQARREYYLSILAEKLKDPEFRKIEGFPIGEDEDILNLSDPPYYTACPNPFIEDFIALYGHPYDPNEIYMREPFATDISEGKYDPIYRMHPYHTKVPYKAIMHYILHYTNPGDLVFDGFCGTGMTGIAAQMCGDKDTVESLGYKVLSDGSILQKSKNESSRDVEWISFSKLGARRAILNDLSTSATFIASNYNLSSGKSSFEKKANEILALVRKQTEWMYQTKHTDGQSAEIEYVIWSDVYTCPECMGEIVFWEVAVDVEKGKVLEQFDCPHCRSILNKKKIESQNVTSFDLSEKENITQRKQVPVVLNYTVNGRRYTKKPDQNDIDLLHKVNNEEIVSWHPTYKMPVGVNTSQPLNSHGFDKVHHFYTRRNLAVLAAFRSMAKSNELSVLTAVAFRITKRYGLTYQSGVWGAGGGPTNGTYYIPSLMKELNMLNMLEASIKKQVQGRENKCVERLNSIITTQSTNFLSAQKESLDYVFIDPPFGSNLNYSELNFMWESWLKIWTDNKNEAIENKIQLKGIDDYRILMTDCLKVIYTLLKPGRWLTIEFSNTSASVWNNIQTSLLDAGFIVSNVSALDKKKGSFKAQTTPTAVKQDLVISAYKPNGGFESRFVHESNEEGIWDFIRTHLGYLPVVKRDGDGLLKVPERDPRILFDQVVSYFVRNMREVPLSSQDFQSGLYERFSDRDGMIFLPEQVVQYDKARMSSSQLRQLDIFVDDEASAIEWLRQLLNEKPQTYQDIHPKFINELSGWKKAEMQLELAKLLDQNFLKFNGLGLVPAQIHSYLSTNFKELRGLEKDDLQLLKKAKDRWFVPDPNNEEQLQALRERDLLKQFEEYKAFVGKKIKLVRLEAVRAGFKKAWQDREYVTIIQVAEKIPGDLLQEDQKLLMWYDQAQTRYSDSNLF